MKLQYFFDKIRLKNNKIVDVVNFVSYKWNKNEFHTIFDYLVFNIKNDLILNENFWQKYRLIFDYDTLKIRVTNENNIYLFSNISNNRLYLQILENQLSKTRILNKRVFERFVRKNATFYLYVIRKKIKKKVVKSSKKLILIQYIIDYSKLNKALRIDMLKIFRNDLSNKLFSKKSQNHIIDIDNVKSINKSFYYFFKKQQNEQITQIDYLLNKDFIRSNVIFWNIFVLFVKKKKWKMCIDYRALNALILKNKYLLSRIQDCLNIIETTRNFNNINLINDYWQINIIEKNCHKIAFNTKREKYEFCVMFFDFANASITFQSIINDILRFFLNKFVIVYLNNILIYFQNDEKYLEYVKLVIEIFHKNDYYAKFSKCFFFQKYIEFYEYIKKNDKIQMNEKKLKIIRNWLSL